MNQEVYIRTKHRLRDAFLDAIQRADLDYVKENLPLVRESLADTKLGLINRLDNDPLRSLKNILLSYNTLYFVFAERGGLAEVSAHYMAEKYALIIEHASSKDILWQIHDEMVFSYMDPALRKKQAKARSIGQNVKDILDYNYMNPISIEEIATQLNLSKEHMMRSYKKEMGSTIKEYLTKKRIKAAIQLLETTNLSILDVALSVGFSSSQYMSQIFKHNNYLSPKCYRNPEH